MPDYPFPQNDPQNVFQAENTFESTPLSEEETERKQLSYKRMTILFTIIALVLIAFILWEAVDLSMGGRP